MTAERTWFVVLPYEIESLVRDLYRNAEASLTRASRLDPGDRTEAVRFESLHAVIDQMAAAAMANGAQAISSDIEDVGFPVVLDAKTIPAGARLPDEVLAWLHRGSIVVSLRLPHETGPTLLGGVVGQGPRPPAERWQASTDDLRRAAHLRFDSMLASALSDFNSSGAVIRPSDVSNTILTESLRKGVAFEPGTQPIQVRIMYRDGSEGPPFPMRALRMTDKLPSREWRVLRFALMSIRHVDMDRIVDGAWFRNSKLSRPRPAGQTDALAFGISWRQLLSLHDVAPVVIHLYQTGLEPAIVGFYRAVVMYLKAHPGTLTVVPHYYEGSGKFVEGTLWRTL